MPTPSKIPSRKRPVHWKVFSHHDAVAAIHTSVELVEMYVPACGVHFTEPLRTTMMIDDVTCKRCRIILRRALATYPSTLTLDSGGDG